MIDLSSNGETPGLVSAIIAVFNGEDFLAEAIRSILSQSYAPIEAIVIDDGSTDGSADVARSFQGITLVRQTNQGLPAAHNAGLAHAHGEFIAFLDADDMWEPDKTRNQVDYLVRHPDSDYVMGHHHNFFPNGVPSWFRQEHTGDQVEAPLLSTSLYRRGVFDKVGLFDPSYRQGNDTEWFARARDKGAGAALLPGVVLQRRIHGKNLSGNIASGNEFMLRAMRASVERKRRAEAKKMDLE